MIVVCFVSFLTTVWGQELLELEGLRNTIPGEPGVDYPIYSSVPETDFSCAGAVLGEYYADVGSQCQAFHVCSPLSQGLAQRFTFLCPNGTMFHQQLKTCHWWFYVDCDSSEQFYNLNPEFAEEEDLGSGQENDDSVKEFGLSRARQGRAPDSDYHGHESSGRYQRRPRRLRQNNLRRRAGGRPSNMRRTRTRRFPMRRSLKAVPSSSFRREQSRKRRARQVEARGQKVAPNSIEQFEDEIEFLKDEILQALSYFE